MTYNTIFEIGPIFNYISSTRKTKDLWGASFLFSYLMGLTAKFILEEEIGKFDFNAECQQVIVRPNLLNDNLFQFVCNAPLHEKISAGSIPDRMYCMLKKETTPQNVKDRIFEFFVQLYEQSKKNLAKHYQVMEGEEQVDLLKQLQAYFRFFYVSDFTNQLVGDELEAAINSRGDIFDFHSFSDPKNSPDAKSEKCSLCGDRKRIVTLKHALRRDRPEHLCAICLIKRGLIDLFTNDERFEVNKFLSTTEIAASLASQFMSLNYDELKTDISNFALSHDLPENTEVKAELDIFELLKLRAKINTPEVIKHLSYQLFFSEVPSAIRLKKRLKKHIGQNQQEKWKLSLTSTGVEHEFDNTSLLSWISRSFFAVVALDGDNIGTLIKKTETDPELNKEFSKAISQYTYKTSEIVSKWGGQLIFCGGEDTLLIIHPLVLLDVVQDLNDSFNDSFEACKNLLPLEMQKFSISAGAVICNHKYPLNFAIKNAHEMLDGVAKQQNDKAALAVQLIKSGSDVCRFVCKIESESGFQLDKFKKLCDCEIPRSFVYKIEEEADVLSHVLNSTTEFDQYLRFLYQKTRGESHEYPVELSELVQSTVEDRLNFDNVIETLYFARFLKGGE